MSCGVPGEETGGCTLLKCGRDLGMGGSALWQTLDRTEVLHRDDGMCEVWTLPWLRGVDSAMTVRCGRRHDCKISQGGCAVWISTGARGSLFTVNDFHKTLLHGTLSRDPRNEAHPPSGKRRVRLHGFSSPSLFTVNDFHKALLHGMLSRDPRNEAHPPSGKQKSEAAWVLFPMEALLCQAMCT
eukprot:200464-Pelagomonas_calceolata.AAC.2